MKKTLIAFALFASTVMAADSVTGSVSLTGGENIYHAGTSYGDLTLSKDMETGRSTNGAITFTPSVEALGNGTSNGSWFGVKNHTVSLWVESASLSSDCLLFGYYSGDKAKSVGYYWDAETSSITIGRGSWVDGVFTFSQMGAGHQESITGLNTYYTGGDGLTNITIAVERTDDYYANGTATVWVNGKKAGTTGVFYSDIHGGKPTSYLVGDASYGTIALTNETLTTAEQIKGLATPAVPEPATATLSLLALAGLAARRRRK